MKSAGVMVALAVVALALQGCATTGATADDSGWHATGPNSAVETTDAPGKPVVNADTKDNFEAVVAAVHKQMAPGGRWEFVGPSERTTIDGNFADMRKLYDKYGTVAAMDSNARIRLAVDQSSINTILTKKDGDKLICESVVPVGSHLPVKTCKTFAQIQREQRNSQEQLLKKTQHGTWQIRSSTE